MAGIIEPLIQETLWTELESRGFSVYGEVTLPGSGQIDLYVVTPNGSRWGIEVKNHWNLVSWKERDDDLGTQVPDPDDEFTRNKLQQLADQLNRYKESGYCDSMYVATQGPEPLIESIETGERGSFLFSKWEDRKPPEYVGAIRVPPFAPGAVNERQLPHDFDKPRGVTIVRHPKPITDGNSSVSQSTLPPSIEPAGGEDPELREADIAHGVWDYLNQEISSPVLREPVIPRKDSKTPQNPDIMHFSGLANPAKVYDKNNPDRRYGFSGYDTTDSSQQAEESDSTKFSVVAIEVKPDLSGEDKIADQLERYLNSGGLTELYLCLPSVYAKDGVQFLTDHSDILSDVGLLVYQPETGGVAIARDTTHRELEYPCLELATNNYAVCHTGWGLAWISQNDKMRPVWDQRDMEGRYDGPDPTERDVSELDWSDDALNADGYDDPEEELTFVECTACDAVVELILTRKRCPECNRSVLRSVAKFNVRKVGTDDYNNTVWTKITE